MNELEKSRIGEIVKLHNGILNSLKRSLNDAIRIGELLTEQKGNLKHGEFTAWVEGNLPFTDRTARRYMRVFGERDRLKTDTVSDLTMAYRLLVEHKPTSDNVTEWFTKTEAAVRELGEVNNHMAEHPEEYKDVSELWEIHNVAVEIEKHSMEMKLVAARKLGELLPTDEKLNEVLSLLNTDYYEFTPIGLKHLRETTKEEWLEYGERLRLANIFMNERR